MKEVTEVVREAKTYKNIKKILRIRDPKEDIALSERSECRCIVGEAKCYKTNPYCRKVTPSVVATL